MNGSITPTGFQAGKAEFHALHPDTGKQADVSGEFDLAKMAASCRLTNGSLRPEMALLVPRGARRWWRTLSATGEIPRLEAACARALAHGSPHYRTVKTILAGGHDLRGDAAAVDPHARHGSAARFARDAADLFTAQPGRLH